MKVRLTKEFRCAPDGQPRAKVFPAGSIVEGGVAEAALKTGHGEKMLENKAAAPASTRPAQPKATAPTPAGDADDAPAVRKVK